MASKISLDAIKVIMRTQMRAWTHDPDPARIHNGSIHEMKLKGEKLGLLASSPREMYNLLVTVSVTKAARFFDPGIPDNWEPSWPEDWETKSIEYVAEKLHQSVP